MLKVWQKDSWQEVFTSDTPSQGPSVRHLIGWTPEGRLLFDRTPLSIVDGFRYSTYIEIPRLGHTVPDGKYMDRCFKFLDKPPKPKKKEKEKEKED